MPTWLRRRLEHLRRVLWAPLTGFLGGAYAALGLATWIRDEFFPAHRDDILLKWLPSWSYETWIITGLIVLVLVILNGSYRAVHGEYDLLGNIQQVAIGNNPLGVGVILVVRIRNVGAPTIINDWSLEIETTNGRRIQGAILLDWPELTLGTDTNPRAMVFTKDKDLMERTIHTPISTGSQLFGVAAFVVQGVEKKIIQQEGTKILLRYKDVRENEHSATHVVRGEDTGAVAYLPGIGRTAQ
jgi:hypothetical protein